MSKDTMSWEDFDAFISSMEQPFYEPIGRYIFRFGLLERKVDESVSLLMGVDYLRVGQHALNEMDFLARAQLIKVFCRKLGTDDHNKRMKDIYIAIDAQNTFRNSLVHGAWSAYTTREVGEGSWQKIGLSRRHHPKVCSFTVSQIKNETKTVETLTHEVLSLCQELVEAKQAAPPPSPDKSA